MRDFDDGQLRFQVAQITVGDRMLDRVIGTALWCMATRRPGRRLGGWKGKGVLGKTIDGCGDPKRSDRARFFLSVTGLLAVAFERGCVTPPHNPNGLSSFERTSCHIRHFWMLSMPRNV